MTIFFLLAVLSGLHSIFGIYVAKEIDDYHPSLLSEDDNNFLANTQNSGEDILKRLIEHVDMKFEKQKEQIAMMQEEFLAKLIKTNMMFSQMIDLKTETGTTMTPEYDMLADKLVDEDFDIEPFRM